MVRLSYVRYLLQPLMNKLIRFRVKLGATLGAISLGNRPNAKC